MISVVMVEPDKPAKTVQIGTDLADLQEAVGGYIETCYPFESDVCIVCNEEGKFNGMAPNRALFDEDGNVLDIIFGPFFVCDCSGENFDSLSPEQMEFYINRFKDPEYFFRKDGKIWAVAYNAYHAF